LRPKFSLMDLLEAGGRLDGDLLRATCTEHPSGLKVIAAPADMIPIEGMPTDHLLRIIELARMLAGLDDTDTGRAHAEELLEAARSHRAADRAVAH